MSAKTTVKKIALYPKTPSLQDHPLLKQNKQLPLVLASISSHDIPCAKAAQRAMVSAAPYLETCHYLPSFEDRSALATV